MNRPLWLDIVYIAVAMSPPIICAGFVARWIGLNGILGLVAYLGMALLALVGWLVMLVVWTRVRHPDQQDPDGTDR